MFLISKINVQVTVLHKTIKQSRKTDSLPCLAEEAEKTAKPIPLPCTTNKPQPCPWKTLGNQNVREAQKNNNVEPVLNQSKAQQKRKFREP